MKQNMLLFPVTVILISLLCAPAAYASPNEKDSMERNGEQLSIQENEIPLLELPSAEIKPQMIVDQQSGTVLQVSHEQMEEAIASVASGDAVRIAVTADRASGQKQHRVSTVLSKVSLAEVAERTDVELEAASDLGQVVFPHTSISSVVAGAAGDEIELVMTRRDLVKEARDSEEAKALLEEILNSVNGLTEAGVQEGTVTEVELISNGQKITEWDGDAILLRLPADTGFFEIGKHYMVLQFSEDGLKTECTGLCTAAVDGSLWMEVSIAHPGIFVVLPEETTEIVENEFVPMVASPLTNQMEPGSSDGMSVYLGGAAILVIVAAAVAVIVWKHSRKS